jgi:hypothetical protein
MSPIRTLLGAHGRNTGEPCAAVKNDCCDAFEGVLPEGQEMKKEIEDAASNRANGPKRVIVTASLLLSGGPNLLCASVSLWLLKQNNHGGTQTQSKHEENGI